MNYTSTWLFIDTIMVLYWNIRFFSMEFYQYLNTSSITGIEVSVSTHHYIKSFPNQLLMPITTRMFLCGQTGKITDESLTGEAIWKVAHDFK